MYKVGETRNYINLGGGNEIRPVIFELYEIIVEE